MENEDSCGEKLWCPATFRYIFFFFFFLAAPHGMWDLSSLTRDRTHAPCSGSAES